MKTLKNVCLLCMIASASLGRCGSWSLTSPGFWETLPANASFPYDNAYIKATTPDTVQYVRTLPGYNSATWSALTGVVGKWSPSFPGEVFPAGTPSLLLDVSARLDGGAGTSGSVSIGNTILADLTNSQGAWVSLGPVASVGAPVEFDFPDGHREVWFNFVTFTGTAATSSSNQAVTQIKYTNSSIVWN